MNKTKDITVVGLMAALVFICTYTIKFPSIYGYSHMGDVMIFLSVMLIGYKKAAFAGGLGAALADLLGGYTLWILPTFFIKFVMATVMGVLMAKAFPKLKGAWILGASIGGVTQIILYTVVKVFLIDRAYAISTLLPLTIQTITGIVLAVVVVGVLTSSKALDRVKQYNN